MDDPKVLWQNQSIEGETMSVQALRERAGRLESQITRGKTIFFVALAVNLLIDVVPRFAGVGKPSVWLDLADLSTFIIWVAYWPYAFAGQQQFTTLSPNLVASPALIFYRRQLHALRDDYSTRLQIAAMIFAVVIHAAQFPFKAVIGIAGGVWVYYSRKRETDDAKHQLQALIDFERQNS